VLHCEKEDRMVSATGILCPASLSGSARSRIVKIAVAPHQIPVLQKLYKPR